MKTRTTSALVLLSALSAFALAPLSAAPSTQLPAAYPVSFVTIHGAPNIVIGDWESDVLRDLGLPGRKLADGTWVYSRFTSPNAQAQADGCTIVLLTFREGRVFDIKTVNAPALQLIAAQVEDRAKANRVLAAKK